MADLLVGDLFRNAAAAVPDRTAAVHGGDRLTFGALWSEGQAVARALYARGVRPGDRVVVWAETTLDQVPVFVGLAALGAVYAPVSGLLTEEEALAVTEPLAPTLVLVDERRRSAGPSLGSRLGAEVVDLAAPALDGRSAPDVPAGVGPRERDAHVVFFTSGSTGRSKGVVLSHRVSWLRSHPGALLEARGPFVCPYPMFHMAVWTQALQQWHARGAIVFTTGDAADICAAITEHAAERINAIPAVWRRILAHMESPAGAGHDLGSLRLADTGTSATPPELLAGLRAALPHASLRVFYGSTESGAATMLANVDIERKPGSVGSAAPFTELRIGVGGELEVRGPQVFDGYYGDAEANAAAFTSDGWYRTGDLAELDPEGFVTIVGRAGDLIRSGGEAVAPAEVEAVLAEHSAVADVAVVGLTDPTWGEVVCAVVVVAPGASTPTPEELAAHCEGRLARFKRPRRVVAVDTIPRTASTGQVQRRSLASALSSVAETTF